MTKVVRSAADEVQEYHERFPGLTYNEIAALCVVHPAYVRKIAQRRGLIFLNRDVVSDSSKSKKNPRKKSRAKAVKKPRVVIFGRCTPRSSSGYLQLM